MLPDLKEYSDWLSSKSSDDFSSILVEGNKTTDLWNIDIVGILVLNKLLLV